MLSDDCVDRPERIGFPFDPALPKRAAEKWGGKTHVGRCLGSWENYVYELQVNGNEAILRLTDSRHRSLSQVTAELRWIEYLYNCGFSVSKPIAALDSVLAHIADDTERAFIACVFTRCKGIQPTPSDCRAMGSEFLYRLGTLLANLHSASAKYRPDSAFADRPSLANDDLIENARLHVGEMSPSLEEETLATAVWLRSLSKDNNFGLIHADLHGRNLLTDGRNLVVIDFDDCCHGWFAYDIAVAVNWAYPSDHPDRDKALASFLTAYSKVRPHDVCSPAEVIKFMRVRLVQDYILTLQRIRDPHYPGDWLRLRAAALEARLGLKPHEQRCGGNCLWAIR
jgi:amicoumacin kinase